MIATSDYEYVVGKWIELHIEKNPIRLLPFWFEPLTAQLRGTADMIDERRSEALAMHAAHLMRKAADAIELDALWSERSGE